MRGFLSLLSALSAVAFELVPMPAGGLPIPTPQQLKYLGSMNALIHFGMSTFFHDGDPGCTASNWNGCDPNGGCNSSSVASFNPTNLNVSNWIESFQAVGVQTAVLTAKHGCGFLAWETKTTLPDGSPYRYHVPAKFPVLKDFVAATEAAGIGHGFYYSLTNNFYLNAAAHNVQPPSTLLPGQANITQAQYEAIILEQVTELWTENGDLAEVCAYQLVLTVHCRGSCLARAPTLPFRSFHPPPPRCPRLPFFSDLAGRRVRQSLRQGGRAGQVNAGQGRCGLQWWRRRLRPPRALVWHGRRPPRWSAHHLVHKRLRP